MPGFAPEIMQRLFRASHLRATGSNAGIAIELENAASRQLGDT